MYVCASPWVNEGGGLVDAQSVKLYLGGLYIFHLILDALRLILSNFYLISAIPFVYVINFWLSKREREVNRGEHPLLGVTLYS